MRSASGGRRKRLIVTIIVSVIAAAAISFFVTDLIRTKQHGLPPVFCIPVIEYDNGSVDYYGLGYKVWEDYHPFDKTVNYYVGFWFIPKFINI